MLIGILNRALALIFFICYAYQFLYLLIPLFAGRNAAENEAEPHRFAVLICARDEENVIAQIIKSVRSQNYPDGFLHIFVCADNCTDGTARAAEAAGAEVYRRRDPERVGKGYALDFLIKNILRDYPAEAFDGYAVFDADNILDPDYFLHMNRTFAAGHDIITGYRNSKNYGDNWISAGYSLWFLRESQYLNRPRFLLGTSCAASGTGFVFSRGLLERIGGWKYFLLTEDIEFTVDRVIAGERIAYCERAVLYDEQPTSLRQSIAQRRRWAKGYIQVFSRYGGRLLRGIFSRRFAGCFDMTMNVLPAAVLSVIGCAANTLNVIFSVTDRGAILPALLSLAGSALGGYLTLLGIGALTLATEWRKIKASARAKIGFLFLFPAFMFTYLPIAVSALFSDVGWERIRHKPAGEV